MPDLRRPGSLRVSRMLRGRGHHSRQDQAVLWKVQYAGKRERESRQHQLSRTVKTVEHVPGQSTGGRQAQRNNANSGHKLCYTGLKWTFAGSYLDMASNTFSSVLHIGWIIPYTSVIIYNVYYNISFQYVIYIFLLGRNFSETLDIFVKAEQK